MATKKSFSSVLLREPRVKKPRGKGKPFVKDDPEKGVRDTRINRKGQLKPRSQRELEALLDEIFDEDITVQTETGQEFVMTRLRHGLLQMLMDNKNVAGKIELLARRYGKIPQPVEGKLDGEIVLRVVREEAKKQDAN